jgi:hypothetical protein
MTLDAQRREELLSRVARRIEELGLTAPAILFLETYKPVAFLGAQLLWVAEPFLNLGFNAADLHDLTRLIEERTGIEELIRRLESPRPDGSSPHLRERM